MSRPKVYFLCTGNSCRSQMAEGWAKKVAQGKVDVYSAGIEAHGLNPLAVATMLEAGVDISRQISKVMDMALLNQVDYAITLCGDANDRCPVTPPHVQRLHWGFEDPAKAKGTDEEIQEKFREVRDAIHRRIEQFFGEILS